MTRNPADCMKTRRRAQAMIEFALVLPLLILFLCVIVDFGFYFYDYIAVQTAMREGARALAQTSLAGEAVRSEADVRTIMSQTHGPFSPLQDGEIVFSSTPNDPAFGGGFTSVTLSVDHRHEFMFPIYFQNEGTPSMPIRASIKLYRVPGFTP